MENIQTYVAFLRGINVGGNTIIKMEALKHEFESLGFKGVKTVLASGNVIFRMVETDASSLALQVGKKLNQDLGLKITVFLRTAEEIRALMDFDPFKEVKITPQTRCHVTFLKERPETALSFPYELPVNSYRILVIFNREICSTLELSSEQGTPELMKFIGQQFGRENTTRNWNTVLQIGKFLS